MCFLDFPSRVIAILMEVYNKKNEKTASPLLVNQIEKSQCLELSFAPGLSHGFMYIPYGMCHVSRNVA